MLLRFIQHCCFEENGLWPENVGNRIHLVLASGKLVLQTLLFQQNFNVFSTTKRLIFQTEKYFFVPYRKRNLFEEIVIEIVIGAPTFGAKDFFSGARSSLL